LLFPLYGSFKRLLFLFPAAGELPCQALPLLTTSRCCPWARREHLPHGLELLRNPSRGSHATCLPGCSPCAPQHLPTSAWHSLGQGPLTRLCCWRGVGSLWQTQGPGMELELSCNSELHNVTGTNAWYFVFPFLVSSQGLQGAFFSFPLSDLRKTLSFSVRTASSTKPSNAGCCCLSVILG